MAVQQEGLLLGVIAEVAQKDRGKTGEKRFVKKIKFVETVDFPYVIFDPSGRVCCPMSAYSTDPPRALMRSPAQWIMVTMSWV